MRKLAVIVVFLSLLLVFTGCARKLLRITFHDYSIKEVSKIMVNVLKYGRFKVVEKEDNYIKAKRKVAAIYLLQIDKNIEYKFYVYLEYSLGRKYPFMNYSEYFESHESISTLLENRQYKESYKKYVRKLLKDKVCIFIIDSRTKLEEVHLYLAFKHQIDRLTDVVEVDIRESGKREGVVIVDIPDKDSFIDIYLEDDLRMLAMIKNIPGVNVVTKIK